MLIDFTVENYRSIKEPVTLSAIAVKRSGRRSGGKRRPGVIPDDEIAPPFVVEGRGFELLPVLGIFGANASGKTNVLSALNECLGYMAFGHSPGLNFKVTENIWKPFAFDPRLTQEPTKFRLRFSLDKMLLDYRLVISRERIEDERLDYVPAPPAKNRLQLVFHREWKSTSYEIKNGSVFGNKYFAIQESLNEDEPFMSVLVLRLRVPPFTNLGSWLGFRNFGIGFGHEARDFQSALSDLNERSDIREQVSKVITALDTGISQLEVHRFSGENGQADRYAAFAQHEYNGTAGTIHFEEESTGTQRLLTLLTRVFIAFKTNFLVTRDEFGNGIHPNITREIIKLYQDPVTNPKRAQLIFTSHDNTLLDDNLLRRDQIWFTEKREDGSTDLFSLSDFKPRNDLAIDKAYLDGRFGAVPFLPAHEFLISDREAA